MATEVVDRTFVDSLIDSIVRPTADQLMETRYFKDLRAGTLTTRRMQGFALQHHFHKRSILKGFAINAVKATDDPAAFLGALHGIEEEITHPDLCKKFGLALGLTDEDFETEMPILEQLIFTGVSVATTMIIKSQAARRAGPMCSEMLVQRYSAELAEYLAKAPYNISNDALEFFTVHAVADIEHAERAAQAVARLATTDRVKDEVRAFVGYKARMKIAKWEGIYDAYA
jgi:pyrroloquinoline quinone (PQQ) biosynthesis protein C